MKLNKYLDQPYGAETKAFRDIPGNYVLSPSSISKFYDNAADWWLDRNGKTTFDGNTATVLGNAIHGAIDAFWEDEVVTEEDVTNWVHARYSRQMDEMLTKTYYGKEITFPKVDLEVILQNFMPMFVEWQNQYASKYPKPDFRERAIKVVMQENIILAGKLDGFEIDRKVVIDYKTCNSKPKDEKMTDAHRIQVLEYAFGLISEGIDVESVRIVYIQRPTKKLPARIWICEEEITDEMLFKAVAVTENMKKSINAVQKHPELEDVIFRENHLSTWN